MSLTCSSLRGTEKLSFELIGSLAESAVRARLPGRLDSIRWVTQDLGATVSGA